MSVSGPTPAIERQQLCVDIVGVGYGPAMGGFLTTLSRKLSHDDGTPRFESAAAPGLPLQVICCERADGLGFGVSGAVTRARGIRASFPEADFSHIPMASLVTEEKLVYLLDPIGASRRSLLFRAKDRLIRAFSSISRVRDEAIELPFDHQRRGRDQWEHDRARENRSRTGAVHAGDVRP